MYIEGGETTNIYFVVEGSFDTTKKLIHRVQKGRFMVETLQEVGLFYF